MLVKILLKLFRSSLGDYNWLVDYKTAPRHHQNKQLLASVTY